MVFPIKTDRFFSVLSQFTRLTDGQTDDRIHIARPRLHSMQHGRNLPLTSVWLIYIKCHKLIKHRTT